MSWSSFLQFRMSHPLVSRFDCRLVPLPDTCDILHRHRLISIALHQGFQLMHQDPDGLPPLPWSFCWYGQVQDPYFSAYTDLPDIRPGTSIAHLVLDLSPQKETSRPATAIPLPPDWREHYRNAKVAPENPPLFLLQINVNAAVNPRKEHVLSLNFAARPVQWCYRIPCGNSMPLWLGIRHPNMQFFPHWQAASGKDTLEFHTTEPTCLQVPPLRNIQLVGRATEPSQNAVKIPSKDDNLILLLDQLPNPNRTQIQARANGDYRACVTLDCFHADALENSDQ